MSKYFPLFNKNALYVSLVSVLAFVSVFLLTAAVVSYRGWQMGEICYYILLYTLFTFFTIYILSFIYLALDSIEIIIKFIVFYKCSAKR